MDGTLQLISYLENPDGVTGNLRVGGVDQISVPCKTPHQDLLAN